MRCRPITENTPDLIGIKRQMGNTRDNLTIWVMDEYSDLNDQPIFEDKTLEIKGGRIYRGSIDEPKNGKPDEESR